jgi:transcriptional regulator with XRE-family HTH domain
LVAERERRGLTQAQVAVKMGTTQPYVARLEAAETDPRLSTLLKYAAAIALGGLLLAAIFEDLERRGR